MVDRDEAPPTKEAVEGPTAPPTSLGQILLRLGPGLILVGNIVGSGELIATPILSAKTGFAFLWLIVFSCIIKVFLQVEIGRYALSEGKTTLEAFDELPGPRLKIHVILWYWLAMMVASLLQQGAMVGGVAQALRISLPLFGAHSENVWAVLCTLSVIVLLISGRYRMIESVTVVLVTIFTLMTLYTVGALQFTDYAFSLGDLFDFQLPEDPADPRSRQAAFGIALMAFGITGVGAAEIIAYPYWCLEKGYGRLVGPRGDNHGWADRARGWIRVMQCDAWFSMVVFTVPTIAFYILGASLLHPVYLETGQLPDKTEMVEGLSRMYAVTFGGHANWIFLIGAFCVLYSTFFVSTAANSRMLADWMAVYGFYDRNNVESRRRTIAGWCVVFPIVSMSAYLFTKQPVLLVTISGVMQALMLPMIAAGVLYLSYRATDPRIRGGRVWYAAVWVAAILISCASLYGAYAAFVQ